MERFLCAECGNVLSIPLRLVSLPPRRNDLAYDHGAYAPRLEPGTYATSLDALGAPVQYSLAPGDFRETRILRSGSLGGCCGAVLALACSRCDAQVARRFDDCYISQEAWVDPAFVVVEHVVDFREPRDPYALAADWDAGAGRDPGPWRPPLMRHRPELVATRWHSRAIKDELWRDDPPA